MKRTLLPLNGLRVFDAAARHLSFTKAADELAVTPAAVGQQIRALEDLLGVILFRRTGRSLELTTEAEAALPALREGFLKFEEAVNVLQAAQISSVVTMAVSPSFASKWLLPRLDGFARLRPDISLRLFSARTLVDFTQENVDLAIRFGEGSYPELRSERLLDEAVLPVAHPRLMPVDLTSCALIDDVSDGEGQGCPTWPEWLAAQGIARPQPGQRLVFNLAHLALDAATAGQGVVLAKWRLAQPLLADGRLVEAGPAQSLPLGYHLVAPEPQWRQKKVRAVVDWLKSVAAEEPPLP